MPVARAVEAPPEVTVKDARLSVTARGASLKHVLEVIARAGGITVVVDPSVEQEAPRRPCDDGARRRAARGRIAPPAAAAQRGVRLLADGLGGGAGLRRKVQRPARSGHPPIPTPASPRTASRIPPPPSPKADPAFRARRAQEARERHLLATPPPVEDEVVDAEEPAVQQALDTLQNPSDPRALDKAFETLGGAAVRSHRSVAAIRDRAAGDPGQRAQALQLLAGSAARTPE